MKTVKSCNIGWSWITITLMLAMMMPSIAMAGDNPEWRPTYDLILRWVNFLILAAVIVKYGREPIKNFFKQQKEDVVSELNELETEKERVLGEIQAAKTQAAESEVRLKELKERLISQGETKKQQIVEQAWVQSAAMIEETHKKMETRIAQAKSRLKMELADLAFEQATQQLPKIITETDNQRLFDIYMQGMQSEGDAMVS
jgi:F-type H+-transporting ATPase subunit b